MLLHCFALQLGEHLFITDATEAIEPTSNSSFINPVIGKRKLHERGEKSDELMDENKDLVIAKGYSLLKKGEGQSLRLMHGSLKVLNLKDIS